MSNLDLDKILAKGNIYDKRNELEYQAARGGLRFAARRATDGVASVFEGLADTFASIVNNTVGGALQFVLGAEAARDVAALAGTFGSKLVGLLGMGMATGVAAAFTQMDYVHQKRNIAKFYSGEIGARLHKSPADVTVADAEKLARDIPVIDEEMRRARRQRNFGVPLAIVSTLISFAAVTALLPAAASALGVALPASMVGSFLLNAAVSMGAYFATKIPLQRAGNRLLDLDRETANDRIFDIKRAHAMGRAVTPLQVLDVLSHGNEKLDAKIAAELGKPFGRMRPEEQELATKQLDAALGLTQMAQDINSGRILATELAFIAAGTSSGVPPCDTGKECKALPESAPTMTQTKFQDRVGRRDLAETFAERVTQETPQSGGHAHGAPA